jgi:3-deoxy-D-manno-octulosonic-acid transferase
MSLWLYRMAAFVLAPIMLIVLAWRSARDRSGPIGLAARFGFGRWSARETLWVHAVSVGEVQAAQPLIAALRERHPDWDIVLTCVTPTGLQRARALFGDAVDLRYLPLDLPGSVRRFLARTRPRMAVLLETEIWPNLFRACAARGIPLLIVNARLSERSLRRMLRFPTLLRATLAGDVRVAAQSAADAQRFRELGVRTSVVTHVGNIKFDIQVPEEGRLQAGDLRRRYASEQKFVWVAASTHEGEESIALQAQHALRAQGLDSLLIIAPRHPRRFAAVAEELQRRGCNGRRWSEMTAPATDSFDVLLIDTLGELLAHYAMADVALVGGSLIPVGGHNLLEPVALGVATLSGPHFFNGAAVAQSLIDAGVVTVVHDADSLARELLRLASDPLERARRSATGLRELASARGAVGRLVELIETELVSADSRSPSTKN